MYHCKSCHVFLYDYIFENTSKSGLLFHVSNPEQVRQNLPDLIDTVLRAIPCITDFVLRSTKGEYEMRTSLIKKPDTKDEECLLRFYILKQLGLGFRQEIHHTLEVAGAHDMIRFRRSGNHTLQADQFLANLYAPLMESLLELHKDHTYKKTADYFNSVSATPIQASLAEDDDLYT